MIMSSYFNVFAPKNYKDLCWYHPKPHFARGVSKLLEGSVHQFNAFYTSIYYIYIYIYIRGVNINALTHVINQKILTR